MKEWRPTDRVPTCSLGWELIRVWADLFPSPRDENAPFLLIPEQALDVVEWYRLHPRTGKFVYRRGCSREPKGTGKSPLEAAKCISELALDVRFDGWNAQGEPVGRPWGTKGDPPPLIQIASLSEDQDENTWLPLLYFLQANDGRLADELRIDAGQTRALLRDRPSAKITPVTSRAGSREGQPLTYGVLDETGLMVASNGGVKLANTVQRNVRKMGGRAYQTTNGFMPGEGSVAEKFHEAVEKGTGGLLYIEREAPREIDGVKVDEKAPDAVLAKALRQAYGPNRWWVDIDRIVKDIRDHDTPWPDAERFFFNWNKKSEAQAVDMQVWAELEEEYDVEAGTRIALGFVGAITERRTVLYGCTHDGHIFHVASWSRPPNAADWRVPRLDVADKLAEAFATWDVGMLYADPAEWYSEVEFWSEEYGEDRVAAIRTNEFARFAPLCSSFVEAVAEKDISFDGTQALTDAVAALAKRYQQKRTDDPSDARRPFVLVKADNRKIEDAIAAVLALGAAEAMPDADDGEFLF